MIKFYQKTRRPRRQGLECPENAASMVPQRSANLPLHFVPRHHWGEGSASNGFDDKRAKTTCQGLTRSWLYWFLSCSGLNRCASKWQTQQEVGGKDCACKRGECVVRRGGMLFGCAVTTSNRKPFSNGPSDQKVSLAATTYTPSHPVTDYTNAAQTIAFLEQCWPW